MRQDAVPELGLRTRDDLVRLRQLLNVGCADDQGVMEELHGANLQHVQDDLSVFRVVLVPTVVQGLARPSETDGGNELQFESGLSEMMRQRPVIVAGRLEPDPNRHVVTDQRRGQTMEVFQRVHDRHSATALLARNLDQHLVAVLGNVDSDQDGRSSRMVDGHSVLRTLSGVVQQNHC